MVGLATTDQGAATLATGWTVGKNATGLSSEMAAGLEQASGTFSSNATTPKPAGFTPGTNGNALVYGVALNGIFDNGNWTFTFAWRSVSTAHTGTLRVRIRVFRGPNADGTGATEITGATQVGTTSGAGSTTVDVISTVTWAPGAALTFNNEYLFIAVAMEVVTASGSNTADALLRTGTSTTGSRILTPNLQPADVATVRLSLTPSGSDAVTSADSATAQVVLTPSGVHEYIDTIYNEENLARDSAVQLAAAARRDAQSIAPPVAGQFDSVDLWLGLVNAPTDDLVVEIRDDSAGSPGSTILASATILNTDITVTLPARYSIKLDRTVSVTGSNTLWIVVRRSGADDFDNYIQVGVDTTTSYIRGVAKNSANSGSSWSASGHDFTFSIPITISSGLVRVTLTPSSSEIYTPGAAGNIFTDSATALLLFTPSGVEERTEFDADTARATLTPSGVDVLAAVDSATAPLLLTPTSVEARIVVDSDTILVTLAPSTTEQRVVADSATASVLLTPSTTDIQQYVEAATTPLALIPSGSDIILAVESGTVPVALTPSAVEIQQAVESATTRLSFTPSGTDSQQAGTIDYLDANTTRISLTPTSVDIILAVDSATTTVALVPSSTEQRIVVDTGTGVVALSPSGADILLAVDSSTTTLALVPSTAEQRVITDAAVNTLLLTPSSVDISAGVDSATSLLGLTPTGVETLQAVDSVTTRLSFNPSGTDTLTSTGTDAATIPLIYTVSGTDSLAGIESATGQIRFTPSAVQEGVERTDANTARVTITPSSVDTAQYIEGGTGFVSLTPTGTDTDQSADNAVASLRYTPSSDEQYTRIDQATALLGFLPSTQEIATYTDSDVGLVRFVPSAVEGQGYDDAGTLYLRLSILTAPTIQYVFKARAYLRWDGVIMLRRWVSRSYERFL